MLGENGTGKTTLANKIAEETKGHVLHCSYNKDWNIEQYHIDIMETAQKLVKYQDVVIDRWAMDEFVYGTVFRGGPSYDTSALIEKYHDDNIVYIYCENEKGEKFIVDSWAGLIVPADKYSQFYADFTDKTIDPVLNKLISEIEVTPSASQSSAKNYSI